MFPDMPLVAILIFFSFSRLLLSQQVFRILSDLERSYCEKLNLARFADPFRVIATVPSVAFGYPFALFFLKTIENLPQTLLLGFN